MVYSSYDGSYSELMNFTRVLPSLLEGYFNYELADPPTILRIVPTYRTYVST